MFLDSAAVWGPVFDVDLDDDGTPERKRDGVHVCPSGAARFALWLTAELAARFDGATPTPPTEWALGDWVTDARYDEPVGSCAPHLIEPAPRSSRVRGDAVGVSAASPGREGPSG